MTWALLTPEDWGLRYAAAVSPAEIATPEAKATPQQTTTQEAVTWYYPELPTP